MTSLTPFFNQEFNFSVRAVEIDGEVWLVGKDVAEALGYANPADAIGRHCKGVAKRYPLQTAGGMQEARILAEGDVYRLIVGSTLPSAERFERWVFDEVLPSIRKTGQYSAPLTPEEMFLAQAQMMVDHQRRLTSAENAVTEFRQQLGELAESHVWDHCPQNCEPITKIRLRMNQRYGLPPWVVDTVIRELPLSLKVHGMVRNNHESAEGSHYEVWAVADVTRVFQRFVSECTKQTDWYFTHPDIAKRFKMRAAGGVQ